MNAHCEAVIATNTSWSFCPNVGAAYLFAVLFGILAIVHISQAVRYRKFYSIVIIVSALLQFITFIMRIISINSPSNTGVYIGWFVVILVAPLFTNAYVYMVMGRMVYNFLPNQKLFGTKPWRFGLYFVLLDVVAFFVQVAGATTASGTNIKLSTVRAGLDVYMAGVGFQELFILIFCHIAIRFQRRVQRESTPEQQLRGLRLLYVLYAVLSLITVRIVFRLVEYSQGINSTIPNHEAYMYMFDTLPMWLAILLLNIVHPGSYMPGKQSEWPSRKERKALAKGEKQSSDTIDSTQGTYTSIPFESV